MTCNTRVRYTTQYNIWWKNSPKSPFLRNTVNFSFLWKHSLQTTRARHRTILYTIIDTVTRSINREIQQDIANRSGEQSLHVFLFAEYIIHTHTPTWTQRNANFQEYSRQPKIIIPRMLHFPGVNRLWWIVSCYRSHCIYVYMRRRRKWA